MLYTLNSHIICHLYLNKGKTANSQQRCKPLFWSGVWSHHTSHASPHTGEDAAPLATACLLFNYAVILHVTIPPALVSASYVHSHEVKWKTEEETKVLLRIGSGCCSKKARPHFPHLLWTPEAAQWGHNPLLHSTGWYAKGVLSAGSVNEDSVNKHTFLNNDNLVTEIIQNWPLGSSTNNTPLLLQNLLLQNHERVM